MRLAQLQSINIFIDWLGLFMNWLGLFTNWLGLTEGVHGTGGSSARQQAWFLKYPP